MGTFFGHAALVFHWLTFSGPEMPLVCKGRVGCSQGMGTEQGEGMELLSG